MLRGKSSEGKVKGIFSALNSSVESKHPWNLQSRAANKPFGSETATLRSRDGGMEGWGRGGGRGVYCTCSFQCRVNFFPSNNYSIIIMIER